MKMVKKWLRFPLKIICKKTAYMIYTMHWWLKKCKELKFGKNWKFFWFSRNLPWISRPPAIFWPLRKCHSEHAPWSQDSMTFLPSYTFFPSLSHHKQTQWHCNHWEHLVLNFSLCLRRPLPEIITIIRLRINIIIIYFNNFYCQYNNYI